MGLGRIGKEQSSLAGMGTGVAEIGRTKMRRGFGIVGAGHGGGSLRKTAKGVSGRMSQSGEERGMRLGESIL